MSTCFDVNSHASIVNTVALQNATSLSSSPTISTSNKPNSKKQNELNLTTSCLSLIVAAGFNKGEIHVFDAFKKEASVFYNNAVSVFKNISFLELELRKILQKKLSVFCDGLK